MKSKMVLLVSGSFIAAVMLGILWWSQSQAQATASPLSTEKVIATVDGEPIVAKELEWQMAKMRTHADGTQDANNSIRHERALNEGIALKVQLIEAKRRGIIDTVRYEDYVKKWQTENKRRVEAIQKNEVVYGPVNFDEGEYYDFYIADILAKLRASILADKPFTSEMIAAFYNDNKSLYRKDNRLQTNMFVVPYGKGITREMALATATIVSDQLKGDQDAENLQQWIKNKQVELQQRAFNEQTEKQDTRNGSNLWNQVQLLKEGEVSSPIEENGKFYVFECLGVEEAGYVTLEKASSGIELALMEQEFPRMIERWVKDSEIYMGDN